jgi:hypothetical protein
MRWGLVIVGAVAAAIGAVTAWAGYEYNRALDEFDELNGLWQPPDDEPPGRPKPPRAAPG